MARYVLGFLFNDDLSQVTLIRKNKPEWQKGRWNGIGGKIEEGEEPLAAMEREGEEEANISPGWIAFGVLSGDGWEIHLFWARLPDVDMGAVKTMTDEEVRIFRTEGILLGIVQDLAGATIGNIKWLVQMALAVATGEDHCRMFNIRQVDVEEERRPKEFTVTLPDHLPNRRRRIPSKEEVESAKKEIEREIEAAEKARDTPERRAIVAENRRRSSLPSEHPEHICGMLCDGQDGQSSYCARLRLKLFGRTGSFR